MKTLKFHVFLWTLLLLYFNQKLVAQSCTTPPSANLSLPLINPPNGPDDNPWTVKVRFIVVRSTDGTEGATKNQIITALNDLRNNFYIHNINFSWACEDLIFVDDSDIYSTFNVDFLLCSTIGFSESNFLNIIIGRTDRPFIIGRSEKIGANSLALIGLTNSKTALSHEVGHCFGLFHPYHGTCIEGSGSDCFGNVLSDPTQSPANGDYVDDTPIDHFLCPGGNIVTNGCEYTIFPIPSTKFTYPKNIMHNDGATCGEYFTQGQGVRMRTFLRDHPDLIPIREAGNIFSLNELNIINDEIWTKNKTVTSSIRIRSGKKLTIKGNPFMTLKMPSRSAIIVERGAVLEIDKAKITSSCGDKWFGIIVEGFSDRDQPNSIVPNINQSGIVYIGPSNAQIDSALYGISTMNALNQNDNNYFGGLVICNNTTFTNCEIGVVIKNFNRTNKCSFTGCTFDGTNEPKAVGISVVGTRGVNINFNNVFKQMKYTGILAINAGVNVKERNTFLSNRRGISTMSTFSDPSSYLEVGKPANPTGLNNRNSFYSNQFHIESFGTRSLNIKNNDFNNSTVSIYNEGFSAYTFDNNSINQGVSGIITRNTYPFSSFNVRKANVFKNNINSNWLGVINRGDSKNFYFYCNTFNSSWIDFYLTPDVTTSGTIYLDQGSLIYNQNNCFTRGSIPDIYTNGNTTSFNYFYNEESPCDEPLYPGNYIKDIGENSLCSTQEDTIIKDESKLSIVRNELTLLSPNTATYRQKVSEKEDILQSLVAEALNNMDYTKALNLLSPETGIEADLARYGIYLNMGNFQQARTLLNTLNNSIPDYNTFRQVQEINIEALGNPYFKPSENQAAFLRSVALGDSPIRENAKGLLVYFYKEIFPDTLEVANLPVVVPRSKEVITTSHTIITPNPANEEVQIKSNKGIISKVVVYDMDGRKMKEFKASSDSLIIDTQYFKNGLYVLKLEWTNGESANEKLIISH